jgi:hypothetical protein
LAQIKADDKIEEEISQDQEAHLDFLIFEAKCLTEEARERPELQTQANFLLGEIKRLSQFTPGGIDSWKRLRRWISNG